MEETTTWWAQTLVHTGGMCSPSIMGIHNVEACGEADAVTKLAALVEAPNEPAPAVLPKLQREGTERGDSEETIIETMRRAVTQALSAEPKGLVITSLGTDFGTVTGLRAHMTPPEEVPAQAA